MKKIPTLFVRDPADPRRLLPELHAACAWVLVNEGRPTRKRDGTATLVRWNTVGRIPEVQLWKRYDAKAGREPPPGFEPAQEPDPTTGHLPGWVPVGQGPEDRWFREAAAAAPIAKLAAEPGTYELCGPKINGNPERLAEHVYFRHGAEPVEFRFGPAAPDNLPGVLHGLRLFFEQDNGHGQIEGIVWHHPDGRMAKIKRRDLGLPWPVR